NIPIGSSKRFKFNTNTRVSYNNRIGYLTVKKQSQRNISGTLGLSENISMSYNKAWYYGQLRANVRFSKTDNTLEGRKSQENTNFGVSYNTQLRFRWNIGVNSNIDYRATRGLSSGYNKDEVIWNGSISKRFLKGNKASVAVEWTDILQQRLSISRNVTANYIEDRESNLLTSYVLVSLSYRFNTMGGKKKSTSPGSRQGSFESY
ncbi:MAG: outer membrane beta-barrel family protein, partial [Bacteroidales bacterium]|nr:outer membrane beta-barrel family protein [Bacteroidales bacterium]